MTVTPEQLAAYADGELEGEEAARVVLAVAASVELMQLVQRHRELHKRIGAEFAPILEQEVPPRLAALLHPPRDGRHRRPREEPEAGALRRRSRQAHAQRVRYMPRRRRLHPAWLLAPVLAAGIALAGFLPPGNDGAQLTPMEPIISGVLAAG